MKKAIALILSLVMCVSLFTACGKQQGGIDEKIRQIDRYFRAIVDDCSNTRYATCYYLVWKQEYGPSKGVNQEA